MRIMAEGEWEAARAGATAGRGRWQIAPAIGMGRRDWAERPMGGAHSIRRRAAVFFGAYFGGLGYSASHPMEPESDSDPLRPTLAAWRVQPPTSADFRPAVWDRIQRRSRDSWTQYVRAHRLAWTVAAVALVAAGGVAGRVAAEARTRAEREAMVVAYLVELDPRVQARLRPSP
jgi:hypothetical protein